MDSANNISKLLFLLLQTISSQHKAGADFLGPVFGYFHSYMEKKKTTNKNELLVNFFDVQITSYIIDGSTEITLDLRAFKTLERNIDYWY